METKCTEIQSLLNEEENQLYCLIAILAREEISLEAFCRIIGRKDDDSIHQELNRLCLLKLFSYRYGNIIFEDYNVDEWENWEQWFIPSRKSVVTVLANLDELLKTEPQTFCAPARLFLTFLMEHGMSMLRGYSDVAGRFVLTVETFVPLVEMSLNHNARKAVQCIEDRLDYCLLLLAKQLDECDHRIYRLIGCLYAENFRYEEARRYFSKAEEQMEVPEPAHLMAQVQMYENLGDMAKAIYLAYRVYGICECNRSKFEELRTDSCLAIAYLCAVCGDIESSKCWLSRIAGQKTSVIQSIRKLEVEAMQFMEIGSVAFNILKKAELSVLKHYGSDAPELGRIACIRCLLYTNSEQLHEANREYRRYIENNCFNYGYSIGGEVALLSSLLNESLYADRDRDKAEVICRRLADLNPTGPDLAPGVRIGYALAFYAFLVAVDQPDCALNCKQMALHLCHELIPDKYTLDQLGEVFNDGKIPDLIMFRNVTRFFEKN